MPVGNRKYESKLQFVFGIVMVAILTQCVVKSLMTLWLYLFR